MHTHLDKQDKVLDKTREVTDVRFFEGYVVIG